MANIIGLQEQKEALSEITAIIKSVATSNKFLASENPSRTYTITFTDAEGKKQTSELTGTKEEFNDLVARYKKEKREEVLQIAQTYRLGLDPEDKEILGIEEV